MTQFRQVSPPIQNDVAHDSAHSITCLFPTFDALSMPQAAAAVAMPAEAEAVAGSGVAAPTSGFLDGGAERYRSLLREREMKAQLRAAGLVEDGGDGTVSASSSAPATAAVQPAVAVKGQKIQSVQASKVRARRLMKELRDVKKCASVTTERVFDVDLHDENLFEWDVWLKKWDPESKIAGVWQSYPPAYAHTRNISSFEHRL